MSLYESLCLWPCRHTQEAVLLQRHNTTFCDVEIRIRSCSRSLERSLVIEKTVSAPVKGIAEPVERLASYRHLSVLTKWQFSILFNPLESAFLPRKKRCKPHLCSCGEIQTMSHIVESCPLTKPNGGLSQLHSADDAAVAWLTNYDQKYARRRIGNSTDE